MTGSMRRLPRARFGHRYIGILLLLGGTAFAAPSSAAGLAWSTFLGGASTDTPYGIAVDAAGDIYVVGTTASPDFPITAGSIQMNPAVPTDVVVTKLSGDGTQVLWSTYLGGSQSEDGRAIAVDAAGNVYVTGNTRSTDFPVTSGAYRTTHAGGMSDAFVAKIRADGGQLLYCTYLGGDWDDYPRAIAVDAAGNAYVAGSTNSLDFPVTSGVVKPTRNPSITDGADGFVTKLNPSGTALVWSTYLGSSGGTDNIFGLAVDASGNPTLVGWTLSPGYPVTANAYDTSFDNRREGFVTRLNATATGFVYSTFIGAEGHDECLAIALDGAGAAYVTGKTASAGFPVTSGAVQGGFGGGASDAFALKLSPAGDALLYSTYLGGAGADVGYGVGVNTSGSAAFTGSTDSNGFPVTPDAYDSSANGGTDCFVTALQTGGSLKFSTYLGGGGNEDGRFVNYQGNGHAIVAGGTPGSGFPTTSGAFSSSNSGGSDDFVTSLIVGEETLAVDLPSPRQVILAPAQPNPYRDRTTFRVTLAAPSSIELLVCDMQGRPVRTLLKGAYGAGIHVATWDGKNNRGSLVPPGVYFVRLQAGESVVAQRVSRLR